MNYTDVSICDPQQPLHLSLLAKIALIVGYGGIGVLSLLGNSGVVLVVACYKDMRSVTNLFISSVSAAALVITAFSLWATPLAFYNQVWQFGKGMCYAVYAIQGASLMWAPFTLAAIAVDRYVLVAFPFRRPMSTTVCLIVVILIWSSAFLVLSPMLAHINYIQVGKCHNYCIEFWQPHHGYRMIYGLSVLAVRSAVPLAVISWCHWRIAAVLRAQSAKMANMRSATSLASTCDIKRKQRLQTLLLSMVIIFAVSSLPIDLFNVLQDMEIVYHMHTVAESTKIVLFFVCHWIAMTGTLLNPLVYAWWNENFRSKIKTLLHQSAHTPTRKYASVIKKDKTTKCNFESLSPFDKTPMSMTPIQEEVQKEQLILKGDDAEFDVQV